MGTSLVDNGYMLFCMIMFSLIAIFCIVWLIIQNRIRKRTIEEIQNKKGFLVTNSRWIVITALVISLLGLIGISYIFATTLIEAIKNAKESSTIESLVSIELKIRS